MSKGAAIATLPSTAATASPNPSPADGALNDSGGVNELGVNAGKAGCFSLGPDSVDESACGDVSHYEKESDEHQECNCDEEKLTGLLRKAEPLKILREINKLTLARPAEGFTQYDHGGESDDNRGKSQASDEKAVECAQ